MRSPRGVFSGEHPLALQDEVEGGDCCLRNHPREENRVFEIRQRDTGELVDQHRHDQTRGVDDEGLSFSVVDRLPEKVTTLLP